MSLAVYHPQSSEAQKELEMPVFGIVPYRTEARTRSEARTQEAVDFMFLILRTINNAIHTAEGRLIELFRPLPVLLPPILPPGQRYADPRRAADRSMRITRHPGWVWGYEGYEEDRTAYHNLSWGAIQ